MRNKTLKTARAKNRNAQTVVARTPMVNTTSTRKTRPETMVDQKRTVPLYMMRLQLEVHREMMTYIFSSCALVGGRHIPRPLMAFRLTMTIDTDETIRSWRPQTLADREYKAHDDGTSALMLLPNERHGSRMEFTSSKWLGSR